MFGSLLLLQPGPPPRPSAEPETGGIDQLAWLVGGTWVSRPDAQTTVAETCTWGLGNTVIFTEVEKKVDGNVVATAYGVFSYDAGDDALRSNSVSSLGNTQAAKQMDGLSGPHTWTFMSMIDENPSSRRQVTMQQLAPDEMTVVAVPMPLKPPPLGGPSMLLYHRQATPP